jgi:hypothetical protein
MTSAQLGPYLPWGTEPGRSVLGALLSSGLRASELSRGSARGASARGRALRGRPEGCWRGPPGLRGPSSASLHRTTSPERVAGTGRSPRSCARGRSRVPGSTHRAAPRVAAFVCKHPARSSGSSRTRAAGRGRGRGRDGAGPEDGAEPAGPREGPSRGSDDPGAFRAAWPERKEG